MVGTQRVCGHDKVRVRHVAGGRTHLDSHPEVLLLLHSNTAVAAGELLRSSCFLPQLGDLLRQLLYLLLSGLARCLGRL